MSSQEGWGRGTWGLGAWGTPLYVNVDVDGQQVTSGLGTPTINSDANVPVTGLGISSGLGTVSVVAKANVSPDSQLITSALGTPTVTGIGNVFPAGQAATAGLGTPEVDAGAVVEVTGFGLSSALGSVETIAKANVTPAGLEIDAQMPPTGPEFTAFNGAVLSTAQKKFGTASLLLDGTNDYVKSGSTTFIDGDFTVEFFVYSDDFLQDAYLWDTQVSNSGLAIALTSLGKLRILKDNTIVIDVNSVLTDDAWNHVALVGSGNFLTVYVNGTPRGQYLTTGGNSYPDQPYYIGCRHTEADFFSGYIDEFRASKVARYSGIFTPTTTEFPVDPDINALLHFNGANGSTDIVNEAIQIQVIFGIQVSVDGQQIDSAVGAVSVDAGAVVELVGVAITSALGSPVVYGEIDTGQDPNYAGVDTSQTPGYSPVSTAQSPGYSAISTTQAPGYGDIDSSQTPNYEDIAAGRDAA